MKKNVLMVLLLSLIITNTNAQIKVKSNGFVGIGNVSPIESLQIGDRFTFHNGSTKYFGYNVHYDGVDKYIMNGGASCIRFASDGNLIFGVAKQGTQANSVGWNFPLIIYSNTSTVCMNYGSPSSNYKLMVGGYAVSNGWQTFSDKRLKSNINSISNALEMVMLINGKTYNYYSKAENSISSTLSYGLLADELQKIVPELVMESDDSLRLQSIDYTGLIPILIEAIKDQQAQIENLNNKITLLSEHKDNNSKNTNNGNYPNPFSNFTQIKVQIPENSNQVFLHIYDVNGRFIRQTQVKERGNSIIQVSASDLSSGLYFYSLIADGIVIQKDKLVVNK